jgi:hypothetical protein
MPVKISRTLGVSALRAWRFIGALQPVVTTTGRGYASPPGLRKFKDIHLAISPETSIWL